MNKGTSAHDLRIGNWSSIMDWLVGTTKQLPQVWPPELPPEETKDFWFTASRFEMQTRKEISARMRLMFHGQEMGDLLPLECWFFRRRIEWAAQIALAAVQKCVPPEGTAEETLEHLLIESWEKDGCISMWNHAERDGRPHPENLDGLSPLASQ
jgi:hypothetical protein